LIRYAIASKNPLVFSKKPGNRLAVGVGGLFRKHLQGLFHGVRIFFSGGIGGRKGKDYPTNRYLWGNFKCDSAIRRDFHGLRNGHWVNIA